MRSAGKIKHKVHPQQTQYWLWVIRFKTVLSLMFIHQSKPQLHRLQITILLQFLDFSSARIASAATDLLAFIHTAGDSTAREDFLIRWLLKFVFKTNSKSSFLDLSIMRPWWLQWRALASENLWSAMTTSKYKDYHVLWHKPVAKLVKVQTNKNKKNLFYGHHICLLQS